MSKPQIPDAPTAGVWRRFFLLLPLTAVLALVCFLYIRSVGGVYDVVGIADFSGQELTLNNVTFSNPGIVEAVSISKTKLNNAYVVFHALADGETDVNVGTEDNADFYSLRVQDGCIIEGGINYSGWESVHLSVCLLLAVIAGLFASIFIKLWRRSWYGYTMVACGGGILFCLMQLALFVVLYLRNSLRNFADLAFELSYMADWFVIFTMIPMAVLAVAVSISNISLIRHEGLRPVNILGIAIGVTWMMVISAWLDSTRVIYLLLGSAQAAAIVETLFSTAITFGECLLLSTMLCAWLASIHVPKRAADYLVVLGCGLRKDGTPCPLLAGRVDKALAFDEQRTAQGDAPATFVPSGGQGPDEVMSEAASMGTYLAGKGVDQNRIVLEDRSTTTRENMAFSREVIERHSGRDISESHVAFSTTNYHVLRGYVCAHRAGFAVEGMGSKTKYYFWPNAFLREFAGLLVTQWKAILQVYLMVSLVNCLTSYALLMAARGL